MAEQRAPQTGQDPEAPRATDEDLVVEPDDSTVDDWFGQAVGRDAEDAERAMREAGGDADRAEAIVEEHRHQRIGVPEDERPV